MKNNDEISHLIKDKRDSEKTILRDTSKNNEIILIFRNQLSSDTILKINKSNISSLKISDITNLLLSKLNKSPLEFYIRLFFKGRPLKQEEKIKDLGKQIIKLRIISNIIIIIYKL